MADQIKDIRIFLKEDFKIQTMSEIFTIPGQMPVDEILPAQEWLMAVEQLGVDYQELEKVDDKNVDKKVIDDLFERSLEMATKGWELSRQLVKYRHPDISLTRIKAALPTVESIAVFMFSIFDEYTPADSDIPLKSRVEKMVTTRSIKSKKTRKSKKSD